jgi:hypothetical protein
VAVVTVARAVAAGATVDGGGGNSVGDDAATGFTDPGVTGRIAAPDPDSGAVAVLPRSAE